MGRWSRERFDGWVSGNRDILFDLIRIYLGVGLAVKGIQFTWDDAYILVHEIHELRDIGVSRESGH